MSIVWRTREWLTVAQLTRAWGSELAKKGGGDPQQCEGDLRDVLLEDIVNGRLDDAGPLRDVGRFGVACITADNKVGCLEGRHLLGLLQHELGRRWFWDYVIVVKEAALHFARLRQLPAPTWWAENPDDSMRATATVADLGPRSPPSISTAEARPRGRRPEKRLQVEEAIRRDIQEGRQTLEDLKSMKQEALASKYGVSRETARKALAAVASEMSAGINTDNRKRDK